ncbi:alpha-glucosidase [Pseudaquabacterium rugosum]|uniref:Alpha-glucosidase n=1 Tax=Pseudaquabacterium rugosum TaxID=2984194 RepID=A0ABU9BGW1_9BURK
MSMSDGAHAWRGAVIYQIYPRSFADGNGDGIGDLCGATARLDHLARLGVDAVWLSPFFKSPMKDFGYDIADYRAVDPMFGTLDDLRALIARAHDLGLKVMIDQVLSHCSDQHAWFIESRASRDNPRADWFVWADARNDGTPPNNWLSIFGGSAWQWDTRRRQYYLHNFLASQPDLNVQNPAVQQALLEVIGFWLDLGVDGFRLDAINFCCHDLQLRDNPGRGVPTEENATAPSNNPYSWQQHLYDKNQPETLAFLERVRALCDGHGDIVLLGEIGDASASRLVAEYTRSGAQGQHRLHQGYCFDLLTEARDAEHLRRVITGYEAVAGDGWPCWALSSHDVVRVATRWGGAEPDARQLRAACALLLSLRGSVCLYQGEELGLPEAEIAFADLRDPYGITMWPEFKGRDGCRTPMPWVADAPDLGFGSGSVRPWLPLAASHGPLAVDRQTADPGSLLNHWRDWLAWRRGQPALRTGAIEVWPAAAEAPDVLLFERIADDGQRLLCAFNLSPEVQRLPVQPRAGRLRPADGAPGRGARWAADGALVLEPWGVLHACCG